MVAVPSRDPARLFTKLMDQDIVTSFRDSNIRATIHCYNCEDDIDTFVAALKAHRAEFHPSP
jgi:selenocysteine lyase/cysteine desulfurase